MAIRLSLPESPYLRGLVLLLTVAATSVGLAVGQGIDSADSVTLTGVVRNPDKRPVAGATVVLTSKSSSQALTSRTDAQGNYRFSGLRDGAYTLQATLAGLGKTMPTAVILEKREQKTVDLTLDSVDVPGSSATRAGMPEFYDEPQFTIAGVTDSTNLGGHASNVTQPAKEALAKDAISLSKKRPERSPAAVAAEKSMREAAEREPRTFDANHELGAMLVADGRAREALLYLERAQQLNPGNYENSYQLAIACTQTSNYDRARTTVQALLVREDKADLHNLLAEIEERAGNPLAAVREYQRAAEMNPTEAYLFDWGAELLAHRALEPAIEVFAKGNRLFAASSRMLIGLGVASYARGDVDAATQRLCAAADIDPDDPTPYLFLGRIQNVETARSEPISERLARFARLHPNNAFANYYYAVSLWKARRTPEDAAGLEQVESLLHKALQLDPKLSPAYLQLGILYAERKNFPKAIDAYHRAIETDSSSEGAHYRLAQIYRQTGESDKARSEIQLYERISQERAKDAERQRHEMQQFVYTLRDHPASPQ
jgi:tetratricopeptide (TPR) repeat protein